MRKLFFLFFLSLASLSVRAQSIKGHVTDKVNAEPLQSAVIKIRGKEKLTLTSGLDGSFSTKALPGGRYEIEVSFAGYADYKTTVDLNGNGAAGLEIGLDRKDKMQEVTVSTRADRSDVKTSQVERRADNIVNAVSSRAIEVSPDLSVANVTQRVSGVSLQRSANGEGQYAIVRGMDKRYNYTLVNGIKIPSPDNKNRYVPLDIFPADLLERLEVTKALTPNMEGDAIGGVVNMVMKNAPDKFSVRANAAVGYAQPFFDGKKYNRFDHSFSTLLSPRISKGENYLATMADFNNAAFKHEAVKAPVATNFGLSAGGRLFHNRLGVLVAGSYQNTYRDVQSVFFKTETNRVDNSTSFTDIQQRQYSIQQQRSGLHARLDYAINKNHSLKLYAGTMRLVENSYRFLSDTNLVLGRVGPGSGRISNNYRDTRQIQNITNVSLQGEHSFGKDVSIDWSGVYSKATGNQPDRGSLTATTGVTKDATTGALVQQPTYLDNSTFRDWGRNSDEDKAGYLNLTYLTNIASTDVKWTVGGMYRDKTRSSDYDNYNLRPSPSPQAYAGNADNNSFAVFNPQGSSTDALNYKAYEKVGAVYGMVKFESGRLQTVVGLRYENTDFNWITAAPKSVEGTTGSIKYSDVLPSVNFKYRLSAKQFLRTSYFSSISRPGFYEVTPHTYDDGISDYAEKGNPYLKRTTAENFDLRYEIFPKGLDQILTGVFYKRISNPIEYAIVQLGANATYYSPANFGNGSNYGAEFDLTRFFKSVGVKANYTYTNSEITTSKIRRFQKTNPDNSTTLTQEDVKQTRPLQGQAKHIANLSLLYKNAARGIDAQLAAVYTGARINTVSPFLDNDVWQKGFVQMDFSAEVRLFKNLSAYVKLNNLLNTPYQLEIHQANTSTAASVPDQEVGKNAFVRKDTYGANYLFGVRFKL